MYSDTTVNSSHSGNSLTLLLVKQLLRKMVIINIG